jgi:DeoR family transcriptional regulator of aga operon
MEPCKPPWSAKGRTQQILELVRESGFARNSELSKILGVSTVTIRQDIEALQKRGLLRKTYGGAAAVASGTTDSAFALRSAHMGEEKRKIGAAAAALVSPGETILIDAGSTTIEIARNLPENQDLTVITCALNVALEAGAKPGIQVILCGGLLNANTLSVIGHQVEHVLAEIDADRLFLATYSVDLRRGLGERNMAGAQVKRALIRAAREVVLVCDSTKFGAKASVITAPLGVVQRVVTGSGIPSVFSEHFRKCGVPVLLV